jgi:hypothetical protein
VILGTLHTCAVHLQPLFDGSTLIDVALVRQDWNLHKSLCDWADKFYWEHTLGDKVQGSLRKAGLNGVLIRISHMTWIHGL